MQDVLFIRPPPLHRRVLGAVLWAAWAGLWATVLVPLVLLLHALRGALLLVAVFGLLFAIMLTARHEYTAAWHLFFAAWAAAAAAALAVRLRLALRF